MEESGIQGMFGNVNVPIEFWIVPQPLALGVLIMDEMRKLVMRMWPKCLVVELAW